MNVVEDDEIRVSEEPNVNSIEEEGEGELELKTMKDHIDLNSSQSKKASKDFKGSLWSKLQKWRQKQKTKKHHHHLHDHQNDDVSATLPVEKPMSRQFRETQSEIADYGFGRRSCDTDPRFSLDIGRVSFDDPRYSLEEPRASWDGYLIGGRTTTTVFPRMPTMLSVVEDAPVNVLRTDSQIPVEDESDDSNVPGGSAQTKEYYSDSFSKRRKSLDRSNSIRKSSASVDDLKCGGIVDNNTNSTNNSANKVNHASVDSMIRGAKTGGFVDGDLRDDCCSETIELGFRDNGASVIDNGDQKGSKKSRLRWSKAWSIWGFIKGGNKDEGRDSRGNGVERSFSESWQELRGDSNVGGFNGRLLRSNSSVSWRNGQGIGGSFGTLGSNGTIKGNGHGKKGKDEFVLERNRSARYSPNNIDNNGLLRFYLTPMRGSRRNGSVKSKSNQAQSVARNVPKLY